jgi:hypothetical protein
VGRDVALFLFVFAGIAAGQAVYWFVAGTYLDQSQIRNVLVVLQLLIGVAALVWLGRKLRRSSDASHSKD